MYDSFIVHLIDAFYNSLIEQSILELPFVTSVINWALPVMKSMYNAQSFHIRYLTFVNSQKVRRNIRFHSASS